MDEYSRHKYVCMYATYHKYKMLDEYIYVCMYVRMYITYEKVYCCIPLHYFGSQQMVHVCMCVCMYVCMYVCMLRIPYAYVGI